MTPIITLQPSSYLIAIGSTATFTVEATGNDPKFYQWEKNGINITGANTNTHTIYSVSSGDVGSYTCTITNRCGSVTTDAALLTVPSVASPFVALYWYGTTDPYPELSTFVDTISYSGYATIYPGDPILIDFPTDAYDNKYEVIRYPDTESTKTAYYHTLTNNGVIPNYVFRDILTFGGYKYIISRTAISLELSSIGPIIFS